MGYYSAKVAADGWRLRQTSTSAGRERVTLENDTATEQSIATSLSVVATESQGLGFSLVSWAKDATGWTVQLEKPI
jgi:hypothetical protein